MNKLVSVIVPVYNRETTISRALESIRCQTYRPIELILVDNNSIDKSLHICREFSEKASTSDFNVKVTVETMPGAPAARNQGVRLSTGNYISFFDSDDEMSDDFISSMVSAFELSPSSDLAICRTRMIFENGDSMVRTFWKNATAADQIIAGIVNTQSFVVSKKLLEDINCWNESVPVWNDYEIGVRLLLNSKSTLWIDKTFNKIYIHSDSITSDSFESTYKGILRSLEAVNDDISDYYDKYRTANKRSKSVCLNSLYLRYNLLAGWLKKENAEQAVKEVAAASETLDVPKSTRFFGNIIRTLTGLGCRGTWRLAKIFSRL